MASTRVTNTAAHAAVSVDATAEIIVDGTTGRTSIVIQNADAADTVYVGTSNAVTAANGIKVAPGASVTFDDYTGEIWGIGSGAAVDVRYFEVGN